ncbi:XrtA/PEP-CTERM system TPR-repeat protein PrsT [Paraglaciecola sp. 2405UD69-4]|uniref:XrtA/PEP-CTERM system TPR-repeat protein PrsT n=1 Tax=Paraglaciecola sp. 2405UD69-4 TaxID=3391836 RepID=UPI0039C9803C
MQKQLILFVFLSIYCLQPSAQTTSNYEKALTAYSSNKFDEAYIHIKNALQENPSDLAAKILMGEILLINGYFDSAITEFEEALNFGADPNLILKGYGKALILTQQFDKILLLDLSSLNSTNTFELLMLKATAFANLNDTNNAERTYLQAVQLQPQSIRALNALVPLYLKLGKIEQAEKYLEKSLLSNNKVASTWRLKGLLEKQKQLTSQALNSFETAYNLNPNDPFVLRAYADGLWAAKKVEEAKKILNIILIQTPDDPYAILLQSQILSATGNTEEAQNLLSQLSQELSLVTGQSVTSNLSLRFASGMTAYLTSNYERALSDITYYVNNSILDVNTIAILTDTYLKLGKERNALKLLTANENLVVQNLNLSLLLCDLYLKANRAFKCENLTSQLAEQYPNNPKVDFIKAKTYVARNKIEDALTTLNNISDPAYLDQRELAKAHLLFQQEDYSNAHKIAKSLLEALPENIDILNLNVALLIKKGSLTEAGTLIEKTLALRPNYVPAKYNKANLLGALKQYNEAIDIMIDLEESDVLQAESYLLFADLLSSLERYEQAIEKLRYASKLNGQSLPISEKLIELYIQTKKYKEALWEIETYNKNALSSDKYQLSKAELLYKSGKSDESIELQANLFEKWKTQPDNLIALSKTQYKTKNFDGVEKTLLTILEERDNKYLPALLQLNNLYSNTNRYPKAQKYLTIANNLYPNQIEVMVAQAKLSIKQNDLDSAYEILWKAQKLDPTSLSIYGQLYQLANLGKGTEKFKEHLEGLLKSTPNKHVLRNLLADTYLQSNETAQALSHYKKLQNLENYTNKPAVLNNLAFIALDNDLALALDLINQGLELAPQSADLIDSKGWVLAKLGQYDEALVLLRQAYAMNSNAPSTLYHLGFTLQKLGRSDEAEKELKSAFELGVPFLESSEAQQLLNSI